MASIAEMLVNSGLQSSQQAPDFAGSIQKGAELAQTVENIQYQRQQMEHAKQNMEMQKVEKIGEWYQKAAAMPDGPAKKAFITGYIPQGINALGMGDKIHPVVQQMLAGEPMMAAYLKSKMQSGDIKYPELLKAMNDPESMAAFMQKNDLAKFGGEQALRSTFEDYGRSYADADKFAQTEEGKAYRTKMQADAAMGRQTQGQDAAPTVEYGKKIASIGSKYNAEGGAAWANKTISNVAKTISELKPGPNGEPPKLNFGTWGKALFGDTKLYAKLDPPSKQAVDRIRGAIKLREILADGNPTEAQVNLVLSQVIDPGIPNEQNIEKLETLLSENITKNNATIGELKRYNLYRGGSNPGTVNVGGIEMSLDQAREFYKAHPQYKPDAATKKALGLK